MAFAAQTGMGSTSTVESCGKPALAPNQATELKRCSTELYLRLPNSKESSTGNSTDPYVARQWLRRLDGGLSLASAKLLGLVVKLLRLSASESGQYSSGGWAGDAHKRLMFLPLVPLLVDHRRTNKQRKNPFILCTTFCALSEKTSPRVNACLYSRVSIHSSVLPHTLVFLHALRATACPRLSSSGLSTSLYTLTKEFEARFSTARARAFIGRPPPRNWANQSGQST